jgi:acyl-CoA reductase-like NAD-dependent aldehyde dehydrogenase
VKMFVAGEWRGTESEPIQHPYSGELVDRVPAATAEDVDDAVSDLLEAREEDFARTISLEEGKPLAEARIEVHRCPELLRLSAFEGSQLRGETLPLDAASNGAGKFGLTLRVPCGVVVAITPFNYPLLLVVHKVGPALAAGNAVILKPARRTPLVALKLTEVLLEAGIPELGIQCITGSGPALGPRLCADARVRKISFTGSAEAGEAITRVAGIKRLSLELGSNSPLVVLADADLEQVATATAVGGYTNAGQACISTQRVLVDRRVYGDLVDALTPKVEAIATGDPLHEQTQLSALITEQEAQRVSDWVEEAVSQGARLVTGGTRDGAVYAATVVADVRPRMRISRSELFGPAVALSPVEGIEEALALANDSEYGLSAGIYTRDVDAALAFARRAEAGNVHINGTPTWRADLMPYGGFKHSGIGKEGARYAVEEMTEQKTIVVH